MFSLTLPTQNVIALSLDLSPRYSLSHWDSMLLAACIEAGVDMLYSEDLDAGMTYDSVTVVNPFV
jgi:predicted nucleic acid-binding protein